MTIISSLCRLAVLPLALMALVGRGEAAQTLFRDDFNGPDQNGLGPNWTGGVFWDIFAGTATHVDALGDQFLTVASYTPTSYTIELSAKVLADSGGPSGVDEFGVSFGRTATSHGEYRLSYCLFSGLTLFRFEDGFIFHEIGSAPLPRSSAFQRWKISRSASGVFRVFVAQSDGSYAATPLIQGTDTSFPTLGQFGAYAQNEAPANTAIDWIQASDDASSAGFAASINFQPVGRPIPAGSVADTGAKYGVRNGLTYGWNLDTATTTRDRGLLADQRFDTLIHLQKPVNPNARWEIAVPNGAYTVRVVAGDQSAIDSRYRIAVEGVIAIDGTPTTSARFIDRTVTVTVRDGRLTVGNATGASNNKLAFLEIHPVPVAPTANG